MNRYYEATKEHKYHWSRLFGNVGRKLINSGSQLPNGLDTKIIEFFNWRLEAEESFELKEYTYWLQAKCLDAKWRLNSYLNVIDLCISENIDTYTQINALYEMIEDQTALVLECFAKLSDLIAENKNSVHIQPEKVKVILKTGLTSEDVALQQYAERARNNLLKRGYFDILD